MHFHCLFYYHEKIMNDGASGVLVVFPALIPVILPISPVSPSKTLSESVSSLVSFQKTSLSLENSFSGSRECIRRTFETRRILSTAISAMLVSLSEVTIKQYTHPVCLVGLLSTRSQVPLLSVGVSNIRISSSRTAQNFFLFKFKHEMK